MSDTSQPVPSIGRIVHYTLSEADAEAINRRREDAVLYAANPYNPPRVAKKPTGFQVHRGNPAHEGDVLPMLIVRVWGSSPDSVVNGQVFLDGNDTLWVTSVPRGEGNRRWAWPTREQRTGGEGSDEDKRREAFDKLFGRSAT